MCFRLVLRLVVGQRAVTFVPERAHGNVMLTRQCRVQKPDDHNARRSREKACIILFKRWVSFKMMVLVQLEKLCGLDCLWYLIILVGSSALYLTEESAAF
jgi:hypothetical protein